MDDATYDLGEGEPGARPRRPGFPVEPRRLLWILGEYRKPLLRAFLIAAAVALVASFFLPKTFVSSAQLLYEGIPSLQMKEKPESPDAFVQSALAPTRLREVRERLGWGISLGSLAKRVNVQLEGKASMQIVAEGPTSEEAHALAQTVLDVFLAHQTSFNSKKLERLSYENQVSLERAKEQRDQAIEVFETFRKKSGKSDLLREQEQLLARSAELRAQADEASVEVAAQRARIAELEQAQEDLPRQIVASAKRGSPIDSPLAQARSELAQARSSLSEEHPRVQALKQRVASLQAQRSSQKAELGEQMVIANPARAAVDQQVASSRAALAAAQERESALRVLLKSVQSELEGFAPEEGEARQLLQGLKVAQERAAQLTERAAGLRDAALGPLTGFRVLSSPMLPEESERSKSHVLMLALFPVLLTMIVALFFLVQRLRSLTLEAPREVAWWGNGPVLGTSVWPRDPEALETFVDELEDQGVYGAGRTLVVPATEAERDIACSFAMRLAEAPWLAAAILDVGDRAAKTSASPMVTPAPEPYIPRMTPPGMRARRLSAQASPSVPPGASYKSKPTMQGFIPPAGGLGSQPPVVTPPPEPEVKGYVSSRPPRKKTVIGLPAVKGSEAPPSTPIAPSSPPEPAPPAPPASSIPPGMNEPSSTGPEPFRRKPGARATVRMIVPVNASGAAAKAATASTAREPGSEEDVFLLTRPVPVASDETPSRVGRAVLLGHESAHASASNAVMRAAVRLLGNEESEVTGLRRSDPPRATALAGEVTGVALAWNGPLSGPVLRRAARLAHRVMVVVSSGMNAIELTRVQTRLGRDKGVGYVLVNVDDAYVDLEDRIGPTEAFWQGPDAAESKDPRLP